MTTTTTPNSFRAARAFVSNRGAAPESFLSELLAWARTAPEEIFAVNDNPSDIYAAIRPQLGPWTSILHRRAAMCEALRVLAGFESSWNWNCGQDTTNDFSDTPETAEAGAFQVSHNSRVFGPDLRQLLLAKAITNGITFQRAMKFDHQLAIEYIGRLLRHTVRANGPVLRHEINLWLSRDSVAEFEAALSSSPQSVVPGIIV